MIQTCEKHGLVFELILGPGGGCPICKADAREKELQSMRDRFAKELTRIDPPIKWLSEADIRGKIES